MPPLPRPWPPVHPNIDENMDADSTFIDENGQMIMPATSPTKAPKRATTTTPVPKAVKAYNTPAVAGFGTPYAHSPKQTGPPQQVVGGESSAAPPRKMRARPRSQKPKPSFIDAGKNHDGDKQRPLHRTSKKPVLDSPAVPGIAEYPSSVKTKARRNKSHPPYDLALQSFHPLARNRHHAVPSTYPSEEDDAPMADGEEDPAREQRGRKQTTGIFAAGSSANPSTAEPDGAVSASADPAAHPLQGKAIDNVFASAPPTPVPHGATMDGDNEADDLVDQSPKPQSKIIERLTGLDLDDEASLGQSPATDHSPSARQDRAAERAKPVEKKKKSLAFLSPAAPPVSDDSGEGSRSGPARDNVDLAKPGTRKKKTPVFSSAAPSVDNDSYEESPKQKLSHIMRGISAIINSKPTAQNKQVSTREKTTMKPDKRLRISALELEHGNGVEDEDGDPFDNSHIPVSCGSSPAAKGTRGKRLAQEQRETKPQKNAPRIQVPPKKEIAQKKEILPPREPAAKEKVVIKQTQGSVNRRTKQAAATQQTSAPENSEDCPKGSSAAGGSVDEASECPPTTRHTQGLTKAAAHATKQDVIIVISGSDSDDTGSSDTNEDNDDDDEYVEKQPQIKTAVGVRQLRNDKTAVTDTAVHKPVKANHETRTVVDDQTSSHSNEQAKPHVAKSKKSGIPKHVAADTKLRQSDGFTTSSATQTQHKAMGSDTRTIRPGASNDISVNRPSHSKATESRIRQSKHIALAPNEKYRETTRSLIEHAKKPDILTCGRDGPLTNGELRQTPKTPDEQFEDQELKIYHGPNNLTAIRFDSEVSEGRLWQHSDLPRSRRQQEARPATATLATHESQAQSIRQNKAQESAFKSASQPLTSLKSIRDHETLGPREGPTRKMRQPSTIPELDEDEEVDILREPLDDQTGPEGLKIANNEEPTGAVSICALHEDHALNVTARAHVGSEDHNASIDPLCVHVRDEAQAEQIIRMATGNHFQEIRNTGPAGGFGSIQHHEPSPLQQNARGRHSQHDSSARLPSVGRNHSPIPSHPNLKRSAVMKETGHRHDPMNQRSMAANVSQGDASEERVSKRPKFDAVSPKVVPTCPTPEIDENIWSLANGPSSDDVFSAMGRVQQANHDNDVLHRLRCIPRSPPKHPRGPLTSDIEALRAQIGPQKPRSANSTVPRSLGANAAPSNGGHVPSMSSGSSRESVVRRAGGSSTWQHGRLPVNGRAYGAGEHSFGQRNSNERRTEQVPEQSDGLGSAMHQVVQVRQFYRLVTSSLY